jgi:ribose-phosphate pyrophosphokinase
MAKFDKLRVFAGSGSTAFVEAICQNLGITPGKSQTIRFSDGNAFVRILENVRGKDVFIVQSLSVPVDSHFVELLFWIDAFRRASAREVTAVIPYFSYAKGDKKDEPRVSIRARVCADCLEATGVDRVLTMDLHTPQIQGFFRVPVDHLYAAPLLVAGVEASAGKGDDWVVVSPDAGYAKMARVYAKLLNAPVALAEKTRSGHDESPTIEYLMGPVKGRRALIVDDFVTSGGTIAALAKRLRQEGATDIYGAITHAICNPKMCERIAGSPITRLFVTDSVPAPKTLPANMSVVSVAPLFAKAIDSIVSETSVSQLFSSLGL